MLRKFKNNMILTGNEILKRMEKGQIQITPFTPENINPNSYDLTLAPTLLIYSDPILDARKKNAIASEIRLTEEGFILRPGELYIGSVNEFTKADGLVGVLYGKSSLGRLGIVVHQTAGFIDAGYGGNITLEITVVKPVRIYPNMKIGQIAYSEEKGVTKPYAGKYQGDTTAQVSKSHKDFT
jgi:dCTP deaminase